MAIYKGTNLISEGVAPKKEIYSTEEKVIGTLNNKPLYRKLIRVINGGSTNYNGWINTGIDFSTYNIDYFSKVELVNKINNILARPYYITKIDSDKKFYVSSLASVTITISTDDYFIFEYTKTTD